MSKLAERVAATLLERSRYVMDGPNYPSPNDCEHLAKAVIAAVSAHFEEAASQCKFAEDKAAMFAAVEEIEEASK